MHSLTPDDIRNLHEYELERPDFRSRVIELKRRRRVALGPLMTLVFENRDTVRFQIQEMLRVERIVQPDKVLHEIETYNELLPGPGEVAATLFIEITDQGRIQAILDGFIGPRRAGTPRPADRGRRPTRRSSRPGRAGRTGSPPSTTFASRSGDEGRAALASGAEAALEVSHGDYRHAAGSFGRETWSRAGPRTSAPESRRYARAAGPASHTGIPAGQPEPRQAAARSAQTARSSTGSSADQATPARASAAIPRGPTRTCRALSTIHSRGVDREGRARPPGVDRPLEQEGHSRSAGAACAGSRLRAPGLDARTGRRPATASRRSAGGDGQSRRSAARRRNARARVRFGR